MITSSQKTNYQYLRKIMVLPVALLVVALFAFSYRNKKQNIPAVKFDQPVTVVIDAGHGVDPSGSHTGVTAPDGSHEDDLVLSIAKKIKELNTNDRIQIILTRENKDMIDVRKRVEISNAQKADLLISLHTNAGSKQDKNTNGIDILFSDKNEKQYAESKILATILYNYFHQVYTVNNIQSPRNHVYIIDNSNCPSALIECGYLTDPGDLSFVKDEKNQAKIATSILQSIEQYFSRKQASDWEERKRVVSDTAWPAIRFTRNAAGKMEGSYNGRKFDKMTEYDGRFAFPFGNDSSTLTMIGKAQTEALKKKYGKDLNELIVNPGKQEAEEKEQQKLKETLGQGQGDSEKAQAELKHLTEEKQLEMGKKETALSELLGMNQLKTEKTQEELKELMSLERLKKDGEQLELRKLLDTLQNNNRKNVLMGDQERLEATQKEFLLKKQEEEKQLEKSKKEYLLKQQEEDAQLEKSKKEFLIKQQEEQKQVEQSTKEYLLKQQKEDAQLEKSKKEFLLQQQGTEEKSEKQTPSQDQKAKRKSKS